MDLLCTENIMKDLDTDLYHQSIDNSPKQDSDSSPYTANSPIQKKTCDSSLSSSNSINSSKTNHYSSEVSYQNIYIKDREVSDHHQKWSSTKQQHYQHKAHQRYQNSIYATGLLNRSVDFVNTANLDPTFLNERCLENALKAEERRPHPVCTYFKDKQTDIIPPMRKIVVEWMMELCAEEKCQSEVVLLAISYMDRFLLSQFIRKTDLQILASACLLLASKLREPSCRALSADLLVFYTDNSIYKSDLIKWELYVLSHLGWDLSTVTPLDFLEMLLIRLPIRTKDCPDITVEKVRQHSRAFISLAAKEHHFSVYTASTIAASSIAAALSGLNWHLRSDYTIRDLLNRLTDLTSVDHEFLHACMMKMEDLFNEHSRNLKPFLAQLEKNHQNHQKYQTQHQSKPQQYNNNNNQEKAPTEISSNSNSISNKTSPPECVELSHNLNSTNGSSEFMPPLCKK